MSTYRLILHCIIAALLLADGIAKTNERPADRENPRERKRNLYIETLTREEQQVNE